ncbi:glycerol kinase [Amphritea balenae]|uniref:Glycerol kinase n=1 Tax=Amphritea balenae TaxID=452629 RepID=A0A3P1SVH8_9GAMM|nr:glycerol kinase [Amphritea balenae]RRD01169.1 glycerol kinase [Amphritea balenae]GGK59368.1 hypothetical protein GCM10007941_07000 [Amphritea balenae]
MTKSPKQLSTSSLAKKLAKTTRQMFAELEALGWIKRDNEKWTLTAKGEFEQGSYRESDKFGRYIVWPESVLSHRALINPEDSYTSAKGLGLKTGRSVATINRLLAELGWIRPWLRGWQVTDSGVAVGGVQKEDSRTAIPYVSWPKRLTEDAVFKRNLKQFDSYITAVTSISGCSALDGHLLRSEAEVKIDNWLYLSGIIHACKRYLPIVEQAQADFYLPDGQLYIEFWGSENDPAYLAEKMRKKSLYQANNLNLLELQESDLDDLDERLPRALRKFGIEC